MKDTRHSRNHRQLDRAVQLAKKGVNGCILWAGGKDTDGYGVVRSGDSKLKAHRAAYMIYHDAVLSPQKRLRHTCKTRHCINPLHVA